MKTLYLDLVGGISGDMFLGVLIDLGLSPESLSRELDRLGLHGWHLHSERTQLNALCGTRVDVHCHEHEHEHHHHDHDSHHPHVHEHRGFVEISQMIDKSDLSDWVKQHAVRMFERIGTAEAKIHGKSLEEIHFHEVGAIDSIVDIVGACVGLELLGKPRVLANFPIDGTGYTHCAHGQIPLPVPATLAILGSRSIPLSQCDEPCEMITPTGATILTEFVENFGPMHGLVSQKIGYSFGSHVFTTRPNMLRAILGESSSTDVPISNTHWETDSVDLLQTNLDDSTPEILGYVLEQALALGALDVWHTPIVMKKGRPAVELSLLCEHKKLEQLAEMILTETSSIGVRHYPVSRFKLTRETVNVQSTYGPIPVKVTRNGNQILHAKPEFDLCRTIAQKNGLPLQQVVDDCLTKFRQKTANAENE